MEDKLDIIQAELAEGEGGERMDEEENEGRSRGVSISAKEANENNKNSTIKATKLSQEEAEQHLDALGDEDIAMLYEV